MPLDRFAVPLSTPFEVEPEPDVSVEGRVFDGLGAMGAYLHPITLRGFGPGPNEASVRRLC